MEKVPTHHLASLLYPFQRIQIQIDHIQMLPSGGFEYALVVLDVVLRMARSFSHQQRLLQRDYPRDEIRRYGVPEVIGSDQGPAFTANLTREIWSAVGSDLGLHTSYNPQSSERKWID
ncbi:unnamed protein product [Ranitomeya imitator]|uniref:Integrase catalytic domain-containing protein n=1 Tax=Ranitomeya imitator TaxID=111125 RepID=A0ABN9LQQ7_9NEOB|nr:unnamed protein product [Ranitomeya imitator]